MIKINDRIIPPLKFPDGTFVLREIPAPAKKDCFMVVEWYYESEEELALLFYLTMHIKKYGLPIDLYLPYIPNARMDRVKTDDEVFTLKYFAEFINSLGFNKVFVLDPHSNVSTALINNVKLLSPFSKILTAMSNINDSNIVLFYPDEGAMKRYSAIIERPYAFGIKRRDWKSGEIVGFDIVNRDVVNGKNVLIVDDICSKGGTFTHSARALKEAGATDIYLYVTHCENTIYKGDLLQDDSIKKIYTTDSLFRTPNDKIVVL